MEITAENMKKIPIKDSDELKGVLEYIYKEAQAGKTSVYIGYIEKTTRVKLEARGFKVDTSMQRNKIDTCISWM